MKLERRAKPVAIVQTPHVEEEIRTRAYELFETRGREDGHELEDWLRAEEEINGKQKKAMAA